MLPKCHDYPAWDTPGKGLRIKQTVAGRLLRVVFGLYFVVAIVVTAVQLTGEYFHVRDSIGAEIRSLQKSFEPVLAESLWRYDNDALRSTLFGMQKLNAVMGIKIKDPEKRTVFSMGYVEDTDGKVRAYDHDGNPLNHPVSSGVINQIFDYSFPVRYFVGDEEHLVGYGSLYSGNRVIVKRIEYGFFMIIINSIIKTTALWLIFIFFIRRIVSAPLGQLSAEADKLNPENREFSFSHESLKASGLPQRPDEVGRLARSIDSMRRGLDEREQKLRDYQNNLESMVKKRTAQLETAGRNIKAIVENIEEGICTISDHTLLIDPEYSGHLETMLGTKDIRSRPLVRLLFENTDTGPDQILIVEDCLKMMLKEDMVNFRLNEHLLPKEYIRKTNGEDRSFLLDWVPVSSRSGKIEKIMVAIRDVTEWIKLKAESREQSEEMQYIGHVIKAPASEIQRLLQSGRQCHLDLSDLKNQGVFSKDTLRDILQKVHSLKGLSRNYGLHFLSDALHKTEDSLAGKGLHATREILVSTLNPPLVPEQVAEVVERYEKQLAKINAYRENAEDHWEILYRDDGRGINLKELRQREPVLWDDLKNPGEFVQSLLFRSGFSGKKFPTLSAGRGIGLQAARSIAGESGGNLTLNLISLPGELHEDYLGCEFSIILPHPDASQENSELEQVS